MMICTHCGGEIENGTPTCPHCGAELNRVQVLAPEERDDFQGLTINDLDGRARDEDGYYEYTSEGPNHRVYVRRINLGSGGLLQKLIIGIVLLGLVIVALPFALIIIGFLIVGWLLSAFLRR